ncbi:hypothetical protein A2U01_0030503, partial [Trifolium medium]|nr:hypothetical protein [Trifolium medium]
VKNLRLRPSAQPEAASSSVSVQQQNDNVRWKEPCLVRLNCNISSFNSLGIKFGLGMYNRDELGILLFWLTERFSPICEVHVGQVLGCF